MRASKRYTDPDLLRASDGAKDNLAECSPVERAVRDATNDLVAFLDNGKTPVVPVEDKARDVLSWHLGQLALEDVLEAREDDGCDQGRLGRGDGHEADDTEPFLELCRAFARLGLE